jgi:hypothetical protein
MIDTAATDHVEAGLVPIGGIVWAGERGIERVQMQVDSQPWVDACILTPILGPLARVI